MGIMRIFWATALCPSLLAIYHAIRTIPGGRAPGTNTGWDMICEWLNRDVKTDVARFSTERLQAYLRRANLFSVIRRGIRDVIHASRKAAAQYMKNVDTDVAELKEMFREEIGRDWREATRRNSESEMGFKGSLPWVELEKSGAHENDSGGLFEWVEGKVREQARWQKWKP